MRPSQRIIPQHFSIKNELLPEIDLGTKRRVSNFDVDQGTCGCDLHAGAATKWLDPKRATRASGA